jgi:hypothetical protein
VGACANSCLYFLSHYGKVLDPLKGIINFETWLHLVNLLDDFEKHRLVIVLKARQIGVSWLLAGYALWKVLFQTGANTLFISKKESDASDLLGKSRFMYGQLPFYMQFPLDIDHSTCMGFKVMKSRLKALPSTEDAGRSEAATLVIMDEWDFHPYAEQNYAALKPTIDAGGQLIGVSTADKTKADSLFKTIYADAKTGENDFTPVFFAWDARPGRDQNWYDIQTKEYPAYLLEQEYPSNEEEALSPPASISYFDVEALDAMLREVTLPIESRNNGMVRIYKRPIVGRNYCVGVDVAEGVGKDASVAIVMDVRTKEVVALLWSYDIAQDLLAYKIVNLAEEYNSALLVPEKNSGLLCLNKVEEIGYRNLYYRDVLPEKHDKPGFETTKANRNLFLGKLEEAIRKREIVIRDREVIKQLYTFILKEGKLQAQEGGHDDAVIALAITNYVAGTPEARPRDYAPTLNLLRPAYSSPF